jgi:hypothetical protein
MKTLKRARSLGWDSPFSAIPGFGHNEVMVSGHIARRSSVPTAFLSKSHDLTRPTSLERVYRTINLLAVLIKRARA